MATVESFRANVQPDVPACPTPYIDSAIVDACRAFARDTWLLTQSTLEVTSAGSQVIDLFGGVGEEVIGVSSVVIDGSMQLTPYEPNQVLIDVQQPGRPTHYWFRDGQLVLFPTPDAAYSLSVQSITSPVFGTTSVDDRYLGYVEAIRAHTLYKIMRTPGAAWSDPQSAMANYALYKSLAGNFKNTSLFGGSHAQRRVIPNFF